MTVPDEAYTGWSDPAKGNAGSTFSGNFHYPNGGADGATHISLVSGGSFQAIDLTAGDGWLTNGLTDTNLHIWVYNGATLLHEGVYTVVAGSKIGLVDAGGMTDVWVASGRSLEETRGLTPTSFQAFATDNVRIGEPVPEPASMAILGLGLAAAARRKRK